MAVGGFPIQLMSELTGRTRYTTVWLVPVVLIHAWVEMILSRCSVVPSAIRGILIGVAGVTPVGGTMMSSMMNLSAGNVFGADKNIMPVSSSLQILLSNPGSSCGSGLTVMVISTGAPGQLMPSATLIGVTLYRAIPGTALRFQRHGPLWHWPEH